MAYTTIDDPSAHFHTRLYDGNGQDVSAGGNAITNNANAGNFQPDWVWVKTRGASRNHNTYDSSRGVRQRLEVNDGPAESTVAEGLQSFDTNGFTVGSDSNVNQSTTIVAWQWKANGGTTSSNSDGNITSTVQANTTAGFSIVTFTGNGNNDATIGHGLGTTPAMIITKNRDDSVLWRVWHQDLTSTNVLFLNEDFAQTAPSGHSNGYIKTVGSSTYSVYQGNSDTNGVNGSGDDMIAYCFAEKQGYSKIGSYVGNGNADGTFVYTGFKPAWILIKRMDSTTSWRIIDSKRDTRNGCEARLFPDNTDAENLSALVLDILSNGFKIKSTNGGVNNSDSDYIYMAFAEHPFVSSKGVPVTAR